MRVQAPHIKQGSLRTIEPEHFMQTWEDWLATKPSKEELQRLLAQTSPHHPCENMTWLYDRILLEIADA